MTEAGLRPEAFAYHVPLDPSDPQPELESTLVRPERLAVGDRLELAVTRRVDGAIVRDGARLLCEVVAVEQVGDEGRRASLRALRAPAAVWDGRLVVRPVD